MLNLASSRVRLGGKRRGLQLFKAAGVPSPSNAYRDAVLADSPLIFLRLNESAGTTAADSSGNGRNGTYAGTYTQGAAPQGVGLGASVDLSTTAYVDVPFGSWMSTGSTWTAECWFRLDSLPGIGGARGTLMSNREDTNANSSWQIQVFNNKLDAFTFYGTSGGNRDAPGTATLNTSTDYHMVVVATPTTLKVYLNNVLDASITFTSTTLNPPTRSMRIGNDERTDRDGIDGKMSNAALYGTALPEARIAAHYAAGIAG